MGFLRPLALLPFCWDVVSGTKLHKKTKSKTQNIAKRKTIGSCLTFYLIVFVFTTSYLIEHQYELRWEEKVCDSIFFPVAFCVSTCAVAITLHKTRSKRKRIRRQVRDSCWLVVALSESQTVHLCHTESGVRGLHVRHGATSDASAECAAYVRNWTRRFRRKRCRRDQHVSIEQATICDILRLSSIMWHICGCRGLHESSTVPDQAVLRVKGRNRCLAHGPVQSLKNTFSFVLLLMAYPKKVLATSYLNLVATILS